MRIMASSLLFHGVQHSAVPNSDSIREHAVCERSYVYTPTCIMHPSCACDLLRQFHMAYIPATVWLISWHIPTYSIAWVLNSVRQMALQLCGLAWKPCVCMSDWAGRKLLYTRTLYVQWMNAHVQRVLVLSLNTGCYSLVNNDLRCVRKYITFII